MRSGVARTSAVLHHAREVREHPRTVGALVDRRGPPDGRPAARRQGVAQSGAGGVASVGGCCPDLQPRAPIQAPDPRSPMKWPQPSTRCQRDARSVPRAIEPVPAASSSCDATDKSQRKALAATGDRMTPKRDRTSDLLSF